MMFAKPQTFMNASGESVSKLFEEDLFLYLQSRYSPLSNVSRVLALIG